MAYRVRSYTGTITLTDHDSMEWVPIQELLCHEQLESDYEISRQMVARRSMNMTIQPMTEHNSREVLEMMRIFYASPAVSTNGSEEIFQADIAHCLSDDPYLEGYVLTEGDHIAGYAMIAKSFSTEFGKHCIWIEDLYFKPEYCQKGYGTQFLQFIGRRYPHAVLRLEVEEENGRAVHTYRKNGFGELPYMEMIR
jgi:ribosomal protein S18 acetylase RimI-like enzyme